ncbi:hypothetical protein [Mycobacterium hubeiense]|uniref:hypothetical protein n=1 Tax=Mycobacterium hubeiense TaxID=1867256 RepID=UPI000C7E89C8|nr:hypothetical protein [Mycobacterium sp. QGD 101]
MGWERDWREDPMVSPPSGWLVQSRAGTPGNFEVVIPWPGGGLAHFWRDNNDGPNRFKWFGPIHFGGSTLYNHATIVESDFRTHGDQSLGNLEVLASRPGLDGIIDHFWRENAAPFTWHGPQHVQTGGPPTMAYFGSSIETFLFWQRRGRVGNFQMATPIHPIDQPGLWLNERVNTSDPIHWRQLDTMKQPLPTFAGIAQGITTVNSRINNTGYKWAGDGDTVFAGIANGENSHIHIVVREWADSAMYRRELTYYGHFSSRDDAILKTTRRWRGIPGMIQGAYGYTERDPWPWSRDAHYGNIELVAAGRFGGIDHFWHDCGELLDANRWNTHWHGPITFGVGEDAYDIVSIIQSTFKIGDSGVLEVVARWRGQPGFHHFWRDNTLRWNGPIHVGQ